MRKNIISHGVHTNFLRILLIAPLLFTLLLQEFSVTKLYGLQNYQKCLILFSPIISKTIL